jgi:hypothetical protein
MQWTTHPTQKPDISSRTSRPAPRTPPPTTTTNNNNN